MYEKMSDKVIVLGVDGFDPSLAKKFMDAGKMPALQEFVNRGSAREDLVLLGGMPTVTPPMWTTLATGAYPVTHGITAFFNQHPEKLDTCIYALDSRMCRAEQLWNVTAEAGMKTLVWHWPGSSWPPTSDSSNLHVVDGTQPTAINLGTASIDYDILGMAASDVPKLKFHSHSAPSAGVNGCVITDLEDVVASENEKADAAESIMKGAKEFKSLTTCDEETEINTLADIATDVCNSPITEAKGWENAPEGAKEFTILTSNGFIHRPCLILRNEAGIYDRIAIYTSKKDVEPLTVVYPNELKANIVDTVLHNEEKLEANRHMVIFELAEDGSKLRYWLSKAYNIKSDLVWHPASLYQEVIKEVGYVPPICLLGAKNPEHVDKAIVKAWDVYCEWQADVLTHFMEKGSYDVIFSHLHNIDGVGHLFWHYAKHRDEWGNDEVFYQKAFEYIYMQTDRYFAKFLKYLDEGWSIIITSDHGLITEEMHPPVLAEGTVSVPVMKELGYTVLQKDENGNEIKEIDWSKTKALALRGGHIYINLKGKYETGIVDPEDKYELEAQIISDLYNYRDPRTGKRVVAAAFRNKDALILGMGGDQSGDILFFMEEGFNIIHMDSFSTQKGYFDTSVSPIFVAAGKGIKAGYTTERHIREVDVAPTVAALLGVRQPAQSEGSVVHQILTATI